MMEVLHDFNITNELPLEYLIQLAGRQKPREFSISGYQGMPGYDKEVHITMAVTEYKTPFKRVKKGVCSWWLAQ